MIHPLIRPMDPNLCDETKPFFAISSQSLRRPVAQRSGVRTRIDETKPRSSGLDRLQRSGRMKRISRNGRPGSKCDVAQSLQKNSVSRAFRIDDDRYSHRYRPAARESDGSLVASGRVANVASQYNRREGEGLRRADCPAPGVGVSWVEDLGPQVSGDRRRPSAWQSTTVKSPSSEPASMATFVGIDLGTTNSAVAHRNAYGRPEVIANREGQNITPSVVYFGTDPPAVGQEAKEWARLGNEEIASFFKPHMGNPQFQLQFRGKSYSATELSTLVLRRLKEDAESRLGEQVDRAVITVPAYFADPQRKATIEAGTAAGLPGPADHQRADRRGPGLWAPEGGRRGDRADLRPGRRDVRRDRGADHARGDRHPGHGRRPRPRRQELGRSDRHVPRPSGSPPRPGSTRSTTRSALNEVLVRSEQAKWTLSERSSARITLQLGTERRTFELSRPEFEAMTFPLMERTRRLTEEALGEAGLTWPRLDGVLLVGGSTRMPMVRSYVSQMSGKAPRAGVNVDEVVALGAAIQAAIEVGEAIGDAVPAVHARGVAVAGRARAAPPRPPRDRRHVAQPGDGRRQPRRLGLRQRPRDPPQRRRSRPATPGRISTRPTAGPTTDSRSTSRRARAPRRWIARSWASTSSTRSSRPAPRSRWTSACRTTPTASCRSGPSSATRAASCR